MSELSKDFFFANHAGTPKKDEDERSSHAELPTPNCRKSFLTGVAVGSRVRRSHVGRGIVSLKYCANLGGTMLFKLVQLVTIGLI